MSSFLRLLLLIWLYPFLIAASSWVHWRTPARKYRSPCWVSLLEYIFHSFSFTLCPFFLNVCILFFSLNLLIWYIYNWLNMWLVKFYYRVSWYLKISFYLWVPDNRLILMSLGIENLFRGLKFELSLFWVSFLLYIYFKCINLPHFQPCYRPKHATTQNCTSLI